MNYRIFKNIEKRSKKRRTRIDFKAFLFFSHIVLCLRKEAKIEIFGFRGFLVKNTKLNNKL